MGEGGGRAPRLRVLAGLLALYLLSYGSVFRLDDEHILAARANSLAWRGEAAETQVSGNNRVRALLPMGEAATAIEPMQTWIGAGLLRLVSGAHSGSTQVLFLLNPLVTVLTAAVVGATVLGLGHSQPTAIWTMALFGLATAAFPYSTTFFRDPLAMLFTSIAFLGWVWMTQDSAHRFGVGALVWILGIVGGVLSKNTVMVLVPAFGLAAIVFAFRGDRALRRQRARVLGVWLSLVVAGIVVVVLPKPGELARYGWEYYTFLGSFFVDSLKGNLAPALIGPFLSPAKSILLFSPALFLVPLGLAREKRLMPMALPAILLALGLALAQGLFYRERWAEASGWGLRFILPAVAPLIVLAAPAVGACVDDGRRGKALLLTILGVGFLVSLGGAWTRWSYMFGAWQAAGLDPADPGFAWDGRFLAIPYALRELADPPALTPAWIRLVAAGSPAAWVFPLSCSLLGWILPAAAFRMDRKSKVLGSSWVAACMAGLLVTAGLIPRGFASDPIHAGNRPEYVEALAFLAAHVVPGDAIVVDSYGTPLWSFMMNRWQRPEPWYSTPYEIPSAQSAPEGEVDSPGIELLQTVAASSARIWYVGSSDAPDYELRTKRNWLEDNFEFVFGSRFFGRGHIVVRLYQTPFHRTVGRAG